MATVVETPVLVVAFKFGDVVGVLVVGLLFPSSLPFFLLRLETMVGFVVVANGFEANDVDRSDAVGLGNGKLERAARAVVIGLTTDAFNGVGIAVEVEFALVALVVVAVAVAAEDDTGVDVVDDEVGSDLAKFSAIDLAALDSKLLESAANKKGNNLGFDNNGGKTGGTLKFDFGFNEEGSGRGGIPAVNGKVVNGAIGFGTIFAEVVEVDAVDIEVKGVAFDITGFVSKIGVESNGIIGFVTMGFISGVDVTLKVLEVETGAEVAASLEFIEDLDMEEEDVVVVGVTVVEVIGIEGVDVVTVVDVVAVGTSFEIEVVKGSDFNVEIDAAVVFDFEFVVVIGIVLEIELILVLGIVVSVAVTELEVEGVEMVVIFANGVLLESTGKVVRVTLLADIVDGVDEVVIEVDLVNGFKVDGIEGVVATTEEDTTTGFVDVFISFSTILLLLFDKIGLFFWIGVFILLLLSLGWGFNIDFDLLNNLCWEFVEEFLLVKEENDNFGILELRINLFVLSLDSINRSVINGDEDTFMLGEFTIGFSDNIGVKEFSINWSFVVFISFDFKLVSLGEVINIFKRWSVLSLFSGLMEFIIFL